MRPHVFLTLLVMITSVLLKGARSPRSPRQMAAKKKARSPKTAALRTPPHHLAAMGPPQSPQLRLSGTPKPNMQCGPSTRQSATWQRTEMWQSKNWPKSVAPSIKNLTRRLIPGTPTDCRTPNKRSIQYDRQ